ncbi:GNAT family N-acetyltransferase [Sphingosinicella terrae]|uniref:GNAT family N-acetyltransferase n=1 Tax=Sphingosinicella terrae TaxID=2172047 RepID=UPI000E0DCB09|nr:N-acetyltransferase [Sphingosinicella terrae]
MSFAVRPETPADFPATAGLIERAFGGADEARLVERLRADGDAAIALVAEADGRILGHILFSPMRAPMRALGLAPLAVDPVHQRQGLGAALVREGLARAAADGWEAIFVLGDPVYYGRFGFSAELACGFESPYAGPYLQALALGGTMPARSGRVDYAKAFEALG